MDNQARIFLLVNPVSGWGKGERLAKGIGRRLTERGVPFEQLETRGRGHAVQLAAEAIERGASTILVCGGDGTLHEAAQAMVHQPARMIPVPAGRCNDFHEALGLSHHLDHTVEVALNGSSRLVDMVKVNGRYYCTVGAIGFDAEVSRYVDEMKTPLRGQAAYTYGMLRVLIGYRHKQVRITWDQGVYEGPFFLAAVGNTRTYGGSIPVTPEAQADDGLMDVCLVGPLGFLRVLRLFPRLLKGTHGQAKEVTFFRTRKLTLESEHRIELWADGEPVAEAPLEIEVAPSSLWVPGVQALGSTV